MGNAFIMYCFKSRLRVSHSTWYNILLLFCYLAAATFIDSNWDLLVWNLLNFAFNVGLREFYLYLFDLSFSHFVKLNYRVCFQLFFLWLDVFLLTLECVDWVSSTSLFSTPLLSHPCIPIQRTHVSTLSTFYFNGTFVAHFLWRWQKDLASA